MQKLQEDKQHVEDRVTKLEKELEKRDAENRKLKEEVHYLREQLNKAGDSDYPLKVP
jgi:cell division protein FtsB